MAIVTPNISGYEPFYIQRDGDASATNILTTFGVIIRDSGYPMNRKAKEPYKNDWKDRSGDDESNSVINYEAFTYRLEGAIFTRGSSSAAARQELKNAVRAFQNWLQNGEFKFYSSYNRFGFQKARVEEFADPGSAGFREFGVESRLLFSFTIKVNDPLTDMAYSNGVISAA